MGVNQRTCILFYINSNRLVVDSDYFCRYTCHNCIIRYIFYNNSVCSNNHIVSYCNRAKHSCSSTNLHVVTNLGNLIMPRPSSDSRILSNYTTFPNFSTSMYDNAYSSISELSTPPNLQLAGTEQLNKIYWI